MADIHLDGGLIVAAVNKAAMDLIKEFEGLRLNAYADPVGVWTIGYGTTAMADVGITPRRGMVITKDQAEIYLERAVDKFADKIRPMIKRPVMANQFGAMVLLTYNIGPGAFGKSTLLRKINAGDVRGAADEFLRWNKAGGKVLAGLTRRRAAERELFLRDPVLETPQSTPVPVRSGFWAEITAWLQSWERK